MSEFPVIFIKCHLNGREINYVMLCYVMVVPVQVDETKPAVVVVTVQVDETTQNRRDLDVTVSRQ